MLELQFHLGVQVLGLMPCMHLKKSLVGVWLLFAGLKNSLSLHSNSSSLLCLFNASTVAAQR